MDAWSRFCSKPVAKVDNNIIRSPRCAMTGKQQIEKALDVIEPPSSKRKECRAYLNDKLDIIEPTASADDLFKRSRSGAVINKTKRAIFLALKRLLLATQTRITHKVSAAQFHLSTRTGDCASVSKPATSSSRSR